MNRRLEVSCALLLALLVVWAAVTIRHALVSAASPPLVFQLAVTNPGINPTTGLRNPGPYMLTAKPINGAAPYNCNLSQFIFPLVLEVDPNSGKFTGTVQSAPLAQTGPTSLTVTCSDSASPPDSIQLVVTLLGK